MPWESRLVFSTFLGGAGGEEGKGIAVDGYHSVYVTGNTGSTDFPTTSGAVQGALASLGQLDVFVTKLNAQGNALIYSTYVGGEGWDGAESIAVDIGERRHMEFAYVSSVRPTPPISRRHQGQFNPIYAVMLSMHLYSN